MKKLIFTTLFLTISFNLQADIFSSLQKQINNEEKMIKFFNKLYACEKATVRDKFFQYDIEGVNNENLCVMTIQNKYSMRQCEFSVLQARKISDAEVNIRNSRIESIISYGDDIKNNNISEDSANYSDNIGYSNELNQALNNVNTCYYLD
tara:strand:+ start:73 stop:522 length:450 start_codon:yes stop_codon:yes gene_type:complete